ncbi:hypothetical protein [Burkholderia diffusa]|uniref:hypothetical protein n=1 Tax=Burkholderia diffusa TaxID=488732 RepID=UPI002ABD2629|nr:hypothetical protein [Burkholderia diffusa]
MAEIVTIEAAATVILRICEDEVDMRTKLERIACAAAMLRREAEKQLEQLDSSTEVGHGEIIRMPTRLTRKGRRRDKPIRGTPLRRCRRWR